MAWVRIEDRQKEWELMLAGLLWVKAGRDGEHYNHYSPAAAETWQQVPWHRQEWFDSTNWRENYIQLEE